MSGSFWIPPVLKKKVKKKLWLPWLWAAHLIICDVAITEAILALSASYGSQICINIDKVDTVALCDTYFFRVFFFSPMLFF
jgi:hypothetical protein